MHIPPLLPLLLLGPLGLAACNGPLNSIARMNELPFAGSNEANIAAMVANPADLYRGHGAGPESARQAEQAIDRLLNDRAKPLPGAGKTTTGGSGG